MGNGNSVVLVTCQLFVLSGLQMRRRVRSGSHGTIRATYGPPHPGLLRAAVQRQTRGWHDSVDDGPEAEGASTSTRQPRRITVGQPRPTPATTGRRPRRPATAESRQRDACRPWTNSSMGSMSARSGVAVLGRTVPRPLVRSAAGVAGAPPAAPSRRRTTSASSRRRGRLARFGVSRWAPAPGPRRRATPLPIRPASESAHL